MDDLSGLDWNAQASKTAPPKTSTPALTGPSAISSHTLANLTAQSLSRPVSSQRSTPTLIGGPRTPVNDSFSNLLSSTNAGKTATNLTLEARQKQLIEERRRQIDEQQKRHEQEARLLDSLGTRQGVPAQSSAPAVIAPAAASKQSHERLKDDEDLGHMLAAFSSSVKVDTSTNFPPPLGRGLTPVSAQNGSSPVIGNDLGSFDDDDDPFELGSVAQKTKAVPVLSSNDDDDILGDLGRPVQQKAAAQAQQQDEIQSVPAHARAKELDPRVAELVDMGFPVDQAEAALQATNHDTQAAVSWLLNKAHDEAKAKTRRSSDRSRSRGRSNNAKSPARNGSRGRDAGAGNVPPWMRSRSRSGQARKRRTSSTNKEKDVAQYATEIGSAFFKSANTLWKQGQKKVQKAVADFQQEGDAGQPKWMRETQESYMSNTTTSKGPTKSEQKSEEKAPAADFTVTNEALLLESNTARPKPRSKAYTGASSDLRPPVALPERRKLSSPPRHRDAPDPRYQQPRANNAATARTMKYDAEAEAATYVSSARRRRPTPAAAPEPEVDLFSQAPATSKSAQASWDRSAPATASIGHAAISSRPKAPTRDVPSLSAADRARSSQHRKQGTEAYKRGDFATAHEHYSAALSPLPATHPLVIIVLCNRAMTANKTGDTKSAIVDADRALTVIGPSCGESETIAMDDGEPAKAMKEFYGKALTRKAEALEHREQWLEAAKTWRLCVEAGLNQPTSSQGRDRCERATRAVHNTASSSQVPSSFARQTPLNSNKQSPTTVSSSSSSSSSSNIRPIPKVPRSSPTKPSAAAQAKVRALRAQNVQADALDDEKFALSDSIDARVNGWRQGKSENLRGLLASLDTVLWEGAGWKKTSMAELVLVPRVKIIYMKAIAKVHPDKIPLDATTEQRMISSSVFATLNEAWDRFKADNGL